MSTMPDKPHTVFVSHAHADNELCDRYVTALKQRGLDVWYDRTNMQDGHFLSEQIATELERRTAFLVLLTPASAASFWVRLEMQAYLNLLAHDSARLFLSVRIADGTVPVLLQAFKWIDALSLGFDATVDALAVALRAPSSLPVVESKPQPSDETSARANARSVALFRAGRYEEALAACERALTLDPNNAVVWSNMGNALLQLGRVAEANAAFQRSEELRKKG